MTTAPGSRNEALWSEMEKRGWMIVKDDELKLSGAKPLPIKLYSITPEGHSPILKLLSALSQN